MFRFYIMLETIMLIKTSYITDHKFMKVTFFGKYICVNRKKAKFIQGKNNIFMYLSCKNDHMIKKSGMV